jgi:hypothetical protein
MDLGEGFGDNPVPTLLETLNVALITAEKDYVAKQHAVKRLQMELDKASTALVSSRLTLLRTRRSFQHVVIGWQEDSGDIDVLDELNFSDREENNEKGDQEEGDAMPCE